MGAQVSKTVANGPDGSGLSRWLLNSGKCQNQLGSICQPSASRTSTEDHLALNLGTWGDNWASKAFECSRMTPVHEQAASEWG